MCKAHTDAPFGVNLAIMFLRQKEEMERAIINWLVENGVLFTTPSAGNPRRHIAQLHDAGVIVYHAVPTLDAALNTGCGAEG